MLATGYKQPSRFGRWCPVKVGQSRRLLYVFTLQLGSWIEQQLYMRFSTCLLALAYCDKSMLSLAVLAVTERNCTLNHACFAMLQLYDVTCLCFAAVWRRLYPADAGSRLPVVPDHLPLARLLPVVCAGARALHAGPNQLPKAAQPQTRRAHSPCYHRSAQVRQNNAYVRLMVLFPYTYKLRVCFTMKRFVCTKHVTCNMW